MPAVWEGFDEAATVQERASQRSLARALRRWTATSKTILHRPGNRRMARCNATSIRDSCQNGAEGLICHRAVEEARAADVCGRQNASCTSGILVVPCNNPPIIEVHTAQFTAKAVFPSAWALIPPDFGYTVESGTIGDSNEHNNRPKGGIADPGGEYTHG
jgi:hypothetical protein